MSEMADAQVGPSRGGNPFDLTGKVALVTGASGGLGQAIAIGLAEAGADVAVHGHSRSLDSTCAAIAATGRRAVPLVANLRERAASDRLITQTIEAFGRFDILVNNAGTIRRAPAAQFSDEDWDAVIEVNLTSVFRLARAAGKYFLECAAVAAAAPAHATAPSSASATASAGAKADNGGPAAGPFTAGSVPAPAPHAAAARGASIGKIVNIASLLSFQGGLTVPAYAAAKGGVAQVTKALSNEWAARGLNVNAIAPGYMATDNTAALRADPVRSRQILERIPAGRWGDARDVAGAAIFLCSSAADYVHGHILVVDGGWLGR
jgi:2-deoxy-D-gluconate 3-dehydrogenase